MNVKVEQYLVEINQFCQENEEFIEWIVVLSQENYFLNFNFDFVCMCNMELFFVRVVLVSEKEVVEVDWACLVKKVNIVLVVKVINVEVEGLKLCDNGKMIFCWSVKNVD